MKLSSTLLVCLAGAIAMGCAHDRPAEAPSSTSQPLVSERVDTATVSESAPIASRVPVAPVVAPPTASPALAPDQTPLTLPPPAAVASPVPPPTPATTPATPATDKSETGKDRESIREVRALLAADPALASLAPHVSIVARDGRVWLRGQVSTAEQRAAVEKAARRAGGVIDVKNDLSVME